MRYAVLLTSDYEKINLHIGNLTFLKILEVLCSSDVS